MDQVEVNTYGELDGEVYAATEIYMPDPDGIALRGHDGLWRRVMRAGRIPTGARPLSEASYQSIIDVRQAEADDQLAAEQASQDAETERAVEQLRSLGLGDDAVNTLLRGMQ